MNMLVGLENNLEGRSLAWALEHPGCFAYGAQSAAALSVMQFAIQSYQRWIADHNPGGSWLEGDVSQSNELQVAGTWEVYSIDDNLDPNPEGDYEVNAWFMHDWKPLTALDLHHAQKLLDWSRWDLLDSVAGLDVQDLDADHPGERWSIAGILKHIAGAEWWYLDRLDLAFPRDQVVDEPFSRLAQVRAHLQEVLPSLEGSGQVVGRHGELWSPRKLVRRLLWHERDHTFHILKLR
ncbi:MAG: hypothetical protein A2Z16_01815 [Chloroflexi bacterium RBG_16_54_18]|nr:MAG: hypothetical protein A2Z16_01815 [Chloroflexi bacterium RBG_16_54_18]